MIGDFVPNNSSHRDNTTALLSLNTLLTQMWSDYIKMNPQASLIEKLLKAQGEAVVNDHIALRTFNHPKLGIESLAHFFKKQGYHEAGEYTFVEKKLFAKHYEHSNESIPKIFISELELEKVSPYVRETIHSCIEQIEDQALQNDHFVFSGRHWQANHATYLKLAAESEYASWVYAYGFRPNHFTVSINHLQKMTDITQLNTFLKSNHIILNQAGGEVKGSAAEFLEQSSTMAALVACQFTDGVFEIPGCYYEFAKRYALSSGKLYQGFIAKSADKIFESTNRQN